MDQYIREAAENETDFFQAMDHLIADLESLGVSVDIPYGFCDIPLFVGHETVEEYERWTKEDDCYIPSDWCGLHD